MPRPQKEQSSLLKSLLLRFLGVSNITELKGNLFNDYAKIYSTQFFNFSEGINSFSYIIKNHKLDLLCCTAIAVIEGVALAVFSNVMSPVLKSLPSVISQESAKSIKLLYENLKNFEPLKKVLPIASSIWLAKELANHLSFIPRAKIAASAQANFMKEVNSYSSDGGYKNLSDYFGFLKDFTISDSSDYRRQNVDLMIQGIYSGVRNTSWSVASIYLAYLSGVPAYTILAVQAGALLFQLGIVTWAITSIVEIFALYKIVKNINVQKDSINSSKKILAFLNNNSQSIYDNSMGLGMERKVEENADKMVEASISAESYTFILKSIKSAIGSLDKVFSLISYFVQCSVGIANPIDVILRYEIYKKESKVPSSGLKYGDPSKALLLAKFMSNSELKKSISQGEYEFVSLQRDGNDGYKITKGYLYRPVCDIKVISQQRQEYQGLENLSEDTIKSTRKYEISFFFFYYSILNFVNVFSPLRYLVDSLLYCSLKLYSIYNGTDFQKYTVEKILDETQGLLHSTEKLQIKKHASLERDISLRAGVYSIVGPSGAGKSTLNSVLIGRNAALLSYTSLSSGAFDNTFLCPQAGIDPDIPTMSIKDIMLSNVSAEDINAFEDKKQLESLIRSALKFAFTYKEQELFSDLNAKKSGLSGGQMKRLALAKVLLELEVAQFLGKQKGNLPLICVDEVLNAISSDDKQWLIRQIQSKLINKHEAIILSTQHYDVQKDGDELDSVRNQWGEALNGVISFEPASENKTYKYYVEYTPTNYVNSTHKPQQQTGLSCAIL